MNTLQRSPCTLSMQYIPYPPVKDIGYPGVFENIGRYPGGIGCIKKYPRISRGVDDSKKGYPQQDLERDKVPQVRIFSGKALVF